MAEYILELRHISKYFPGVQALKDVHFQLKPAEIHAIMGENGAGKSTLIKIITGVYQPDEGEIYFNGERIHFKSPLDAQRLGIAAVYQHVACFPDLSVLENIFLGHESFDPVTRKIRWRELRKKAEILLQSLDADFSPSTTMGNLSIAQQQIVEIAKALSVDAKILIMDEPTAPLSRRECEDLYHIVETLRDKGVSIIFISHRIEDMYRLAERVTVLRDGNYIATWDVPGLEQSRLVQGMVGREITQYFPSRHATIGEEIFRVEGLSRTGFFKNISFSVRRGEIVALTGLVGAGRTEICESIYGIAPRDSGRFFLEGKEITINTPAEALIQGIGYLPEDRMKQGLVLDWDLIRNITLASLRSFCKNGFMQPSKERDMALSLADNLKVKASNIYAKAATLSGGNQQKLIVAKLLTSKLKLIILDEPTKGVDVGAKTEIYRIMNQLAEEGYGIIMISSEMPEVLGMSDRIVVIREGRKSAEFETPNASQQAILESAMTANGREAHAIAG
ncbi:MAG: sugar ABC transporter ATP-binding protein [Spirochaetota bacterium]|jgi:rhamnose transport system ATP-binding protein